MLIILTAKFFGMCGCSKMEHTNIENIREFLLQLPDVTEGVSYGMVSFKVGKRLIFAWQNKFDAPVFKITPDEEEFLLENDSETFFTTDHHRKYHCIMAYPDKLNIEWARSKLYRDWRELVAKRVLKKFDAENPNFKPNE